MEKVDTSGRLAELRKLMKQHGIDVYSKMAVPTLGTPPARS